MSSLDPKKIMNVGIMILGAGIVLPYLGGESLGKDLGNLCLNIGILVVIGGFLYNKFGKKPPQP